MKLNLISTLAIVAAGPAFADGHETPEVSNGIALFDIQISSTDLGRSGNDSDFDDSGVFGFNGQARLRYDNIGVEIQGALNTDANDSSVDDEIGTSFGVLGHYIMPFASGDAVFTGGLLGAQSQSDSQGTAFGLIGASYATNAFNIGLGHAEQFAGDRDSDQPVSFTYLQGGLNFGLWDAYDLGISAYVGESSEGDGSDNNFHELNITLGRDFNDRMRGTAGIGIFNVEGDGGGSGNEAEGAYFSLELSISLGGTPSQARDAIPFDTPYFHRVMSWTDEL